MTHSRLHWENIYKTKPADAVSWFAPHLEKSLELISGLGLPKTSSIIDVGGGAATLVDDLLSEGFKNLAVLDISGEALEVSKKRLGEKARSIEWLEADITAADLKPARYDLWHDRAVFHFLTNPADRRKYVDVLRMAVKKGGHVLIAAFGPQGPLKCSGLDIVRYSAEQLQKELGPEFQLKKTLAEVHKTPFDTTQDFLYALFTKELLAC